MAVTVVKPAIDWTTREAKCGRCKAVMVYEMEDVLKDYYFSGWHGESVRYFFINCGECSDRIKVKDPYK